MSKYTSITTNDRLLDAWTTILPGINLGSIAVRCVLADNAPDELQLKGPVGKLSLVIRAALYPSRGLLTWLDESERRTSIVLCPHLPDGLAADLRKAGINHADLNGRLFVQSAALLIDREPKGTGHRNPISEPGLFTGRSSHLIRLLLHRPECDWVQNDLVARTGLSRGLVSRLLQSLVRQGYVTRERTGPPQSPVVFRLKAFAALLDAWKEQDDWHGRVELQEFSVLAGELEEIAAKVRASFAPGEVAFTQWFAAALRHPYTVPPLVSAYVRKERLIHSFPARKVSSGGNLWLLAPADDAVFFETQEVGGFPLVSDIQLYLDLLQVGQRGPEQAEALRQWEGFAR